MYSPWLSPSPLVTRTLGAEICRADPSRKPAVDMPICSWLARGGNKQAHLVCLKVEIFRDSSSRNVFLFDLVLRHLHLGCKPSTSGFRIFRGHSHWATGCAACSSSQLAAGARTRPCASGALKWTRSWRPHREG